MADVGGVYVYQARYRVPVSKAMAGNLVLIEGIDATITKTATLVAEHYDSPVHIFRPLRFQVGTHLGELSVGVYAYAEALVRYGCMSQGSVHLCIFRANYNYVLPGVCPCV